MKKGKEYFKKKKYILLFLSVLFLFGLVCGVILVFMNVELILPDLEFFITNMASHTYQYIFFHFFILVMGLILSFVAIGIPLLCTVIFYEGLIFGFILGLFTMIKGVGGLLFAILFLMVTQVVFTLCLAFFFLKCLEIARRVIGKMIYKTDPHILLIHFMKACFLIIFLVFGYDVFLFFYGHHIISNFQFLLL